MRIAEVAETYQITPDTLRYYERIGLLPRIRRNASGVRDYSEADCGRIEFIKCMRGANVSIEALQAYMRLLDQGEDTVAERKAILEEQRDLAEARIAEMQAGLDRLNYKIENYGKMLEDEKRFK
ncbi:MerR family transcriptional regulator [Collinsella intestinalis]|uniref:MerR family transcriptional regulator n=1 Tax=Collinsella intestinalis TaxID=147207 RepID=UPI00195D063C|nr:MerR family transcriptional regulator [Collinsella intestinalis]MBM6683919.1 MerR family transcriptional regulator [Collinsella intestinalis]